MPRTGDKGGSHAQQRWPVAVTAVFAVTGLLFVTAAVSARGDDLRPSGGDLESLLTERSQRAEDRQAEAARLRGSIDQLSGQVSGTAIDDLQKSVQDLQPSAGLTEVQGGGLRVVLTDAPENAGRRGLDPNVLVVHEQDIQAYVNALWAGGAEAVSLQGQRLISTTGIKCVGNTVLLDGVPYSPPYRIEAVGDTSAMLRSIAETPETVTYADYSREYGLGLEITPQTALTIPAYAGQVDLRFARAAAGES